MRNCISGSSLKEQKNGGQEDGKDGSYMDGRRVLSLDLETYSDVDLGKCGVYRYVEGDFHILLCAYAFDDEDAGCRK